MKKASLISVALLLVLTGQAQSHWPPTDPATILPQNPTRSDVVTITLSGVWCSICIPNASAVSVVGNSVYFDVITRYPEDLNCILIPAAWQLTQFVGPLPPGRYTVYTRWLVEYTSVPWSVQNDTYIPIAEFTVTGQYYYAAVDGNDSNNGLTPETAFATIQKGIDTTVNGDTVMVLPGTYTGSGNRDIDLLGKAITVRSTDPNDPNIAATTVIDCQHLDGHRGFYFHSGEDANSIVDGFTIKNGREWQGGGIKCTSSSPTISNCVIRDNEAVTSGMWHGEGGAIQCEESRMTLSNCHLADNTSSGPGGAICSYSYSGAGNISLLNCTFIGNWAEEGGAIYCSRDNLTLLNCLIRDNTASKFGGGVHSRRINPTISNCTISHNSAFERGGGIYCWAGHTMVRNAILWDNCAPTGQEIKLNSSPFGSTQLTICYSVVQGGTDSVSVDSGCVLNWTAGNIDTDPCFADPCNGDYHLQSTASRCDPNSGTWVTDTNTSRCIDAGNPGSPPADEPAPNGNRINMGAYGGTAEASKSPVNWALLSDLTNDGKMNHDDLGVFVGYWLESGENLPSDLDRNQSVDSTDYAIFAGQWSDAYVAEPTIAYEVSPCDPNQVQDSSGPRFRAWAVGSYIHFEDMINANCCADEIELQMTVEGNQITIREIEHLTIPCDCMCDFPTTAILGPFEDGIYLVEVIDIYGSSLGIVIVIIGGSPEPGITYQVGDCNEGASASLSLSEQSDETRFTVTVEGLYIHFEDMMVANCCPDELELQMTVQGNLITMREIEHTTMPCHCICEYPITATLGPFEPGTYTLEVYQHNYSTDPVLVGSTTVIID